MESVGFKEWALVCEALGSGEQCILLRKGGIAEGRNGFGFRHTEFFLFPTFFHEQVSRIRLAGAQIPAQAPGKIEIKLFGRVEICAVVVSWKTVVELEPFHILDREVVRERFSYDKRASIHVGFVRLYRLEPSWRFPDARSYGGCRSWVRLSSAPKATKLMPVLPEEEHQRRKETVSAIIGQA